MRSPLAMLLVLLVGFQPPLALAAQEPASQRAGGGAVQRPPPGGAAPPTVEALGVSFERIKRELQIRPASPSREASPLKLDFYVEVMGIAPEIPLFTAAELAAGPVPGGGAPTHQDMLQGLWTKPELKGQSMPIGNLVIGGMIKLAQWQVEQAKKRRAEAEQKQRLEELKAKYPDLVIK